MNKKIKQKGTQGQKVAFFSLFVFRCNRFMQVYQLRATGKENIENIEETQDK